MNTSRLSRAVAVAGTIAILGSGLAACGSSSSSAESSSSSAEVTTSTTPGTDACASIPENYIEEPNKAYTAQLAGDCSVTFHTPGESYYNSMIYKNDSLKRLDGGAFSWSTDSSANYTYIPAGQLTKDAYPDAYNAAISASFTDDDLPQYAWVWYQTDGSDTGELFREYTDMEASESAAASASGASASAEASLDGANNSSSDSTDATGSGQ